MNATPQRLSPAHPTLRLYALIAFLLFLVTLLEFLIILPDGFGGQRWTYFPLIVLSAFKFVAVILFYMHLKFDKRLLAWVFLGGLGLSVAVSVAIMGMLGAFDSPQKRMPWTSPPCCFNCTSYDLCQIIPDPPPDPPTPDPQTPEPLPEEYYRGREIFLTGVGEKGNTMACYTCHTIHEIPEAGGLLGPDLTHIGTEAATRRPGMSAREYLEEAISDPEVFIPEDVDRAIPGLMLSSMFVELTPADVEALVEFLLAQE